MVESTSEEENSFLGGGKEEEDLFFWKVVPALPAACTAQRPNET